MCRQAHQWGPRGAVTATQASLSAMNELLYSQQLCQLTQQLQVCFGMPFQPFVLHLGCTTAAGAERGGRWRLVPPSLHRPGCT